MSSNCGRHSAPHLPVDRLVGFDIVLLAGFDVRDEIHAGLATQRLFLVDATGRPKDFTRFLFLTGLLGDSRDRSAVPGSMFSKFDDFGASRALRVRPFDGTFSLCDTPSDLVQ
jgi:hypothetical protein